MTGRDPPECLSTARIPRDDQQHRRDPLERGLADGARRPPARQSGIAAALAIIGYVKTHHRRMLAREHWVRVPELTAGERSGLFAMEDALYGCHLRVGDPGPWAGPWSGIARLQMPSGIGRDAALDAADHAAGWLPGFASAAATGTRGPR